MAAGLCRATASSRVRWPMPTPLGLRNRTLRGAWTSRRSVSRGALREGGPSWARSRLATASGPDRKSTRLNSSHPSISYAVFCLKKKKTRHEADASDELRDHRSHADGEGVAAD